MAGKHSVVVRLPSSLSKDIGSFARKVEREHGVRMERKDAAEALIRLGLRVATAKASKR